MDSKRCMCIISCIHVLNLYVIIIYVVLGMLVPLVTESTDILSLYTASQSNYIDYSYIHSLTHTHTDACTHFTQPPLFYSKQSVFTFTSKAG